MDMMSYNISMNFYFRILILLIVHRIVQASYAFHQQISYPSSYNSKVIISPNGSKMIAGNTNRSMIIYNLVDGQFIQSQAFVGSESIKGVFISGNQQIVLSARQHSFQIYRYNNTSNAYQLQQDQYASSLTRAKVTEDLEFIFVCGYNPWILVYKYDGTQYLLHQNLTEMSDSIIDIYLTSDNQYMLCGGYENKVRIYQNNGNSYAMMYQFSISITIFQVYAETDISKVYVSGANSYGQVYYLQVDQYLLSQTLGLSCSVSYTLSGSSSSQIIAIGGNQPIITFFRKNSLGSMISDQNLTIAGETGVMAVWFDYSGSIISIATTGSTYIYLQCKIQNCDDCSMIYECSTCGTGYNLHTDGLCYIPGTEPTNFINETNSTVDSNGTNSTVDSNGTNSTANVNETNSTVDSNGTNSTVDSNGTNSTANVNETNSTVDSNGTNSTVDSNGTNSTVNSNGTNSTVDSNGTNSTLNGNGTNDTLKPNQIPDVQKSNESTYLDSLIKQGCLTYSEEQSKCLQFCDGSCISCLGTKDNCTECSELFEKQEDGTCSLPSSLKAAKILFSVASMFRHRKSKILLFILDDIWLYQYHKFDYKGLPETIFQSARIIESAKDEIIDLSSLPFIQELQNSLERYDHLSNKKYLALQRKNDSLPENIIEFVIQVIPFTIVIFLLNKLLFWLLSDYPCSIYFRTTSFNGFLVVSLLQGNIEYFVFLGMRNLTNLFAVSFIDKVFSIFVILFMFIVVFFTVAAYFLLYYFYEKLFKYFLDNLYRISGSVWMMALIYGLRPFLKGCIHSLMYENNQGQLFLLGLIDFIAFCIIAVVQTKNRNFKSQTCFCFMAMYIGSGLILNALLYANLKLSHIPEMLQIIDSGMEILLLFRIISLVMACIFNLLELFKYQKDILDELNENEGFDIEIHGDDGSEPPKPNNQDMNKNNCQFEIKKGQKITFKKASKKTKENTQSQKFKKSPTKNMSIFKEGKLEVEQMN